MKSSWFRTIQGRWLVVVVVIVVYLLLLVTDGLHSFPLQNANTFTLGELGIRVSFSALVAFLFLGVGAFTWLYARDRQVAALLFCFATASMISIAVQTAALRGDALFSAIGGAASAVSLLPLFLFLLLFPKNYLAGNASLRVYFLRSFLVVLFIFSMMTVVDYAYRFAQPNSVPGWLEFAGNMYFPGILLSILGTLILSPLRTTSVRERQQIRFLLGGSVLALAPLLLFTVLPVALNHPQYAVDGQISTLFYFILPLSLGYSVLRYQVLVFDRSIRRTVTVVVGSIAISVLCYAIFVISSLALPDHRSLALIYGVGCAAIFSPCLWWLSLIGTEHFLFRGEVMGRYRLLAKTTMPIDQKLDLSHAVERLLDSAREMFQTEEACLFVLNTDASSYLLHGEDVRDDTQQALLQRLHPLLEEQKSRSTYQMGKQVVQHMASSHRPLLIDELTRHEVGVSSYLNTQEDGNILLAPIRVQEEMIAILLLGKRTDNLPYGGPDFDVVQLLIGKYSSILGTALITEELRMAYLRLKELDRLKNEFIVTTSHELRTPVTAVHGYLEITNGQWEKLSDALRQKFIRKAYAASDELVEMLNTIMDGSAIEQDISQVRCASVLLKPIFDHVLEVLDQTITREQRSVHIQCDDDLVVVADELRLRQVVLNLVTNALKYSSPSTTLEIGTSVMPSKVEVHIRDYGLGVPPEEQIHLFERFVRLERDMNSPVRGAGLGLYICRRLVQSMGGAIWIESTGVQGEGSRFVFTLSPGTLPSAFLVQ